MPPVKKINLLPHELRIWLRSELEAHGFGSIEAVTEKLNQRLAEEGLTLTIGKSAVGEESKEWRAALETMAATTRQMQQMAEAAKDPADLRGESLNAMVSEGMFKALLLARKAESEMDPVKRINLMNKAALASARLTTTSVRQRRWRAEVEEKTKAAAEAVTKIARQGGMSPAQVREIRSQILGIAKQSQATEQPAP